MAVRTADSNATSARRAWFVAVSLIALFVVALFLRAYWNLDAAHPEEGKFVLSGGSDPYYHKRAVDAIQQDSDGPGGKDAPFTTLIDDPMLNYPYGSINPNPPLFQWTAAFFGSILAPLFGAETAEDGTTLSATDVSTWWAFLWIPALFGALMVFPLYFIGKSLFDWRVGLVAALLWVFSTSGIDGTGLGLADHDAMLLFFAVLAFLFYIKTIEQFRGDGNWVTNWRSGSAIGTGFRNVFSSRRLGFLYALLAGVSIGAVALVWKGFPYVIGIIFLYAVIQLVTDHWRNRDSTGLFLATALAFIVGVAMAWPYYAAAGLNNFVTPVWFIIIAFVAIGVVLVPTRDMPSVLVFPAAAVVGLLAALVALFVFPNVAQKLLFATVYFKQSTLYTTIAEAHPADFATIAFGVGPIAFLLAIGGWFYLLFRRTAAVGLSLVITVSWIIATGILAFLVIFIANLVGQEATGRSIAGFIGLVSLVAWFAVMLGTGPDTNRSHAFALVWGAVALYMAGSAVRFLFNAIPVFAVFAGFAIVAVVDWLDFGTVRKTMAGAPGWQGFRKAVRPMHVLGVLLIATLLVLPNAMLAADAAIPRKEEVDRAFEAGEDSFTYDFLVNRFGAYGQNFLDPDWQDALAWLDAHDAAIEKPEERPGFLSWWDYGHWAIAVGKHPAVADNFQNGYDYAAEFILSQNETHAVQLLAARLLPLMEKGAAESALTTAGAANGAAARQTLLEWGYVDDLDLDESVDLLLAVETATGKKIRYFATDFRMMPLDDPNTPGLSGSTSFQEQSSIFYAPVTLAERKGDDYVALKINLNGEWLTQDEYTELARNPISQLQPTGERLEYQQPFFDSMFYRAFVGTPVTSTDPASRSIEVATAVYNCPLPGFGLQHFRTVYANGGVKILEFSPGALIEGVVTEDGSPAAGVNVTVYDNVGTMVGRRATCPESQSATGGVPHATVATDADGRYSVRSPFALENENITLVVSRGGVEIQRANVTGVTRDAAAQRQSFEQDVTVDLATVQAHLFLDTNSDGIYTAANDTLVENVNVTIAGRTSLTDSEGNATITNVPGGSHAIQLESDVYEPLQTGQTVQVRPGGEPVVVEVPLRLQGGTLDAVLEENGVAINESIFVDFEPDTSVANNTAQASTGSTGDNGTLEKVLRPGTYRVNITGWTVDNPVFIIEPGQTTPVTFIVTRMADASASS